MKRSYVVGVPFVLLALSACAPTGAVMQDASVLAPGESTVTPYLNQQVLQTELGVRYARGLTEWLELQAGAGTAGGLLFTSRPYGSWGEVGLKVALLEDHLALVLPVHAGGATVTGLNGFGVAALPTLIGSFSPFGEGATFSPFVRGAFAARVTTFRRFDPGFGGGLIMTGMNMKFAFTPWLALLVEGHLHLFGNRVFDDGEVGGWGRTLTQGGAGLGFEFTL